ncbi:MAG: hypothetical protein LAQ69_27805 [Acidobacteriia bacterium]|nr:hypothetical protein [Terriglobia bacterium]
MKRALMAAVVAASSFGLYGQAARDPDDVLSQVRAKLRSMTERLPKYTCVQTVERRYFKHGDHKGAGPSCDQIIGDRKAGRYKLQLYATDRLRLDVAEAEGREIVSWAGAGKFDSRTVDEIVGEGPTGTGAFGGHLVDVFANRGVHFQYLGEKDAQGKSVLEYRFAVPLEASNYRVRGKGDWHITAYDGNFQVDAQSLELERLDIRTDELPPDTGMCEARTDLEYQHLRIGDGEFLLPRQSQLQIVQTDARETLNVTTFSACREYHTDSTIRFDGEAEAGSADAKAAATAAPGMPAGLSLSLALTAPIDTNTAAAGDPVSARVTHAVRDLKSKGTLIPAGAVVRGRIARMRHRVGSPDDFVILISFDSLEVNGVASPLSVKLDFLDQIERAKTLPYNRRREQLNAYQGPETWGALIFPATGSRYVVPAGYESKWLTTAPPAAKQ